MEGIPQMVLSEIIKILEEIAPPDLAESWDNSGLLVGRPEADVRGIFITLDVTTESIRAAAHNGCDLIVAHHPLLFSSIKKIRYDDFIGSRLIDLIENHIACYAMHTNYDAAVMADLCDGILGLNKDRSLEMIDPEGRGIGSIGHFDRQLDLEELADLVKTGFGLPYVRVYGDRKKPVKKVAMCPGSGKSLIDLVSEEDCDVYITGDVDHHFGLDCLEKGIAVIDAGHHGLEHVFVDHMSDTLQLKLPDIRIVKDRNISPFDII